ncbi:MAG: S41 family peptidase [Caulobacter sp.]|nr:S41 family peptidase [Caulobacter sp.]
MSAVRILAGLAVAMLLAVAGAAGAEDSPAPVAAPADWGQALVEDARAFHDMIADSHPGPVDRGNPGFNSLLEAGLRTALERAKTADSYEDWYFALQAYAASFDDGHLSLSGYAPMGHAWRAEWPGFLTGLREGRHTVVFSRDPAAPPIGAVLASCGGQAADAFAADNVGRGAGRWALASRRAAYAPTLFVDQKNPYVTRPSACVFEVGGAARTYHLTWRDLPDAVRDEGFAAARSPRFTTPVELRAFGRDGGLWIGLGSFRSEAASEEGRQLTALQAAVEAGAADIRQAPLVVFDLRGNNGGSSSWINGLVRTLWGREWVDAKQPASQQVEWRPSQANIDQIVAYHGLLGDNPDTKRWLGLIEAGLREALARGRPLWRQTDGEAEAPGSAAAPTTPMKARVYVLTDYGCASACLDAVDVLKALGAVQVGQETSGDTVYMEVRYAPLPGGRVKAGVPMKVYRGRVRGNNETAVPDHAWTGALGDTAGLEAWITTIDAAR